ncbi:hypothetical protein BDP27DRAFT_1450261 [Rhodocollybia butyracea]|uniref:Uncharacterized protein n=1 Tax=Rhodocollybia butyracea TaxID=206335 RepID=A0A9P5PL46_9AGAR|nr:hypothetical protein BDP27DRAFT_1450261 [Rhodocollybia butyracea]
MTPDEVAETLIVEDILLQDLAEIIITSTLFGVYCLVSCISLYIYFTERKSTTGPGGPKKAMTCVLLGTFVLMLVLFVLNMASVPLLVEYNLVEALPGGIMGQIVAAESQSHHSICIKITNGLMNVILLIADTVIVWRAWAVWMNNKKVKWTLLMVMFADISVSLADFIADSRVPSRVNSAITLDWVYIVLSLFINMIATCLIAFRTWRHHNSVKSFSIGRRRTRAEGVLLLLLESGAIYALLQFIAIIIYGLDSVKATLTSPIPFVTFLICQLYIYAAALNPVVIFILVQIQNTYEQSVHLSEEISTLSRLTQSQHVPATSNRMDSMEGTSANFQLAASEQKTNGYREEMEE